MKEIIITNSNSEIVIDFNLSYYLFSHFFISTLENKEDVSKENLILEKKDKINDLHNVLEKYLKNILNEWYQEPSEKELQKHSTRYEKITLDNKIYKINYRMFEIGRLVYLLYSILQMLNVSYIKGESINIRIIHK